MQTNLRVRFMDDGMGKIAPVHPILYSIYMYIEIYILY